LLINFVHCGSVTAESDEFGRTGDAHFGRFAERLDGRNDCDSNACRQ